MKKVIYAMMFCASSAVFAQPNDGESYYIKSFNGHFVYTNGESFGLGDESQKTAFTMVRNGDKFSIKTPEGRYISASFKGEDVAGKVVHQPEAQGWEEFSFEKNAEGKYAIKSAQWNSYLRANGDQLDQTDGTPDLWETFELVNVAPVVVTPVDVTPVDVTPVEPQTVVEQAPAVAVQSATPKFDVTVNGQYNGVTLSKDGKNYTFLKHKTVVAYITDSKGLLWFATDDQGIEVFNPIIINALGDLGENTTPVAKFDHRNWTKGTLFWSNNSINAMHMDEKGQIWIALEAGWTTTGGLARYVPSTNDHLGLTGTWSLFTKADGGLPSNHVRGFAVENDGSTYVKMMKEGNVPVQMPLADLDNK